MRAFLLTIFLVWVFANIYGQEATPPNVIFIICDDLNDYQGVFGGHPQAITPNMDKLADSGVQFVNAQSNSPVCMPSRNSLFTGVYPHESKDFGWTSRKEQPVLQHNRTIMDMFKINGYYLAGTGKLLHNNEPEDWDTWGMNEKHNYGPFYSNGDDLVAQPNIPEPYASIGPIDGSFGSLASIAPNEGKTWGAPGWVYGWDKKPVRYINDDDRDLLQDELHANWAIQKLKEFEQQDLGKPFFMGIGFVRPHTPMHAPQKYFDMYPLGSLELSEWLPDDSADTYYKDNFSPTIKGLRYYRTIIESYGGDRELAMKMFLQAYLACVTFVDEQIGKVLDALDKSPFRENTIVILTSDHGWQMGEKNYLFKNSAWEESARVPLVIRTPESEAGEKVDHPVSLIDIFPTLVDFCELEGNHKLTDKAGDLGGYSLRPFLENHSKSTWEGPEAALTIIGNAGIQLPLEKQNYSVRTKDWRYIKYSDGSEEMYDHTNDPFEWNNLANDNIYKDEKQHLNQILMDILTKK
jgi:arylsulfatase A-like enzyme